MIFQDCEKVLKGIKTQTRRLKKPGDRLGLYDERTDLETLLGEEPHGRIRGVLRKRSDGSFWYIWEIGRTYAVQPGRGKKATGRMRVLALRGEQLLDISYEDLVAEGINDQGPGQVPWMLVDFCHLWSSIHTKANARWENNPEVWTLEFEPA